MATQNRSSANLRRCPVTHHTTDQEDFEHDFTTQGKASELGCPFAKIAPNGLPATPNSQLDPIAAEFHVDNASTNSRNSASGGLGKCPIRFLEKHSPEEVAKYFENHKHELPRSHEICVRRYRQSEQSVRQLDAKYGSLVNMIQDLGVKHKQYLPGDEKGSKQDQNSTSVVENWASEVNEQSEHIPHMHNVEVEVEPEQEHRLSHFEKPLREIRVGESPSRPWGISVPQGKEIPASALQSENGSHHEQVKSTSTSPVQVTMNSNLGLGYDKRTQRIAEKVSQETKCSVKNDEKPTSDQPQIIFNGPVFFGYSAEDTAQFLKTLNINSLQTR